MSHEGQGVSLAREGCRWAKTWVHRTPTLMPSPCRGDPPGGVPAGNGAWAAPVRGRIPSRPPGVQRGRAGWPLASAPLPAFPSRPFSISMGHTQPKEGCWPEQAAGRVPPLTAPVFSLVVGGWAMLWLQRMGFSLQRLLLLRTRALEHWLSSCGSRA